jgi:Aerotolerance regulator N-terminal
MDISLLHAGLAAGAALAAIPVILHLFMRQTPKHVIFPALRLIRERHKRSKKQLKVKNWLLLAARMLLLALMALALARPTLNSETSLGDQEVATALAFVFDTSMSMQYTERGNDRLKEAKLRAAEILKKTTDDSEVFVIDSADPIKHEPVAPGSALKRIDALELRAANRPLNAAVVQASNLVAASNLARREVYVLTDLASSAWELGSTRTTEDLEKIRKEKKGVKTYVLRLTPKEIKDVAVVSAEPSSAIVSEGEPVEIKAVLRSTGPAVERVAEFWLDGDNKKDQKIVKIPANGEVEVTFTTPSKLEQGLHQGRIKLGTGTDFMAFDDVRYFSFNVQPSLKILIVADVATADDLDARYVASALAPTARPPEMNASPYKVERDTRKQFQDRARFSFKDFSAVFLLNVDGLSATDWGRLSAFVREGGGLVIAPGDRSQASTYGTNATALLPATLDEKKVAPPPGLNFAKAEYDHPIFNRHPQLLDPELTAWPVYRYWSVKPLDNVSSRTLLRYSDGAPALLERAIKGTRTGHVLLWTTPLARRPSKEDSAAWNEFPLSWAFVDLLTQTIPYLAGTAGERLNYEAGQDAILTVDPNSRASNYIVQGPDPKVSYTLAAPTSSDVLLISSPQKEGQWKVEGKGPDGSQRKMGFSINVSPLETQVVALKPNDLDGLFGGKENYQIADDAAALEKAKTIGRIGYDLFPWLMLLILAIVTAENLLANKFHRTTPAATSRALS